MRQRNKILVVDDNEMNLTILEEIFKSDYRVRTCTSGEEALGVLTEFQPEIVLLDIMMPGIDGYEVCRRIRQEKKLAHTKVIMVSAKAMVDERLKGYEVGADDYVTKPFNDDELLSKVRVFLRLKSVEEVDEFKTETLRMLSDQLRTPLRSLTLPAEILQTEETIDDEKRKRYATVITRNVERLQRFLDKVLTITEMRAGKWKFREEELDLRQLAHSCITELEDEFSRRNVRVDEETDAAVELRVDENQLRTVLSILLGNAARFSPSGESVTVSILKEDDFGCVNVTDRGKGISPDALPRVFDGLANLAANRAVITDDADWQLTHGLSLALAHEIVEQHGGELSVTSEPGSETTFTIRLPLASSERGDEADALAATGTHSI